MKRILGFLILMFMAVGAKALPLQMLAPLRNVYEEPEVVTVSTSAWTNMVPAGGANGRVGMYVKPGDGNSGDLRCITTNSSSAPSLAITVEQFKILRSGNAMWISLDPRDYLWCVDDGTASEDSVVTEMKGPSGTNP